MVPSARRLRGAGTCGLQGGGRQSPLPLSSAGPRPLGNPGRRPVSWGAFVQTGECGDFAGKDGSLERVDVALVSPCSLRSAEQRPPASPCAPPPSRGRMGCVPSWLYLSSFLCQPALACVITSVPTLCLSLFSCLQSRLFSYPYPPWRLADVGVTPPPPFFVAYFAPSRQEGPLFLRVTLGVPPAAPNPQVICC